MKVKFVKNVYVNFDQIKIGEIFETNGIIYLKINETFAFDIFNKKSEYCKGLDTLIPRKSELIIYQGGAHLRPFFFSIVSLY